MNKNALPGIAIRLRWAINDKNRNEMQKLSDQLLHKSSWKAPLREVSKALIAKGLITRQERTTALNLLPTG